jgi:hypothetical protein
VAAADLNGDGRLDLVVVNNRSNDLSMLWGNGDGTFEDSGITYATGADPTSVAVADLNGDGKPDLAVTNATYITTGTVSVLLNTGAGFTPHAAAGAKGASGRPDLVDAVPALAGPLAGSVHPGQAHQPDGEAKTGVTDRSFTSMPPLAGARISASPSASSPPGAVMTPRPVDTAPVTGATAELVPQGQALVLTTANSETVEGLDGERAMAAPQTDGLLPTKVLAGLARG